MKGYMVIYFIAGALSLIGVLALLANFEGGDKIFPIHLTPGLSALLGGIFFFALGLIADYLNRIIEKLPEE